MPRLPFPHSVCHVEASPTPASLGPHLLNDSSPALNQKLRKEGTRGVPGLEPSVCWLVTPTPGPQKNSKLVGSCLAVSGDV